MACVAIIVQLWVSLYGAVGAVTLLEIEFLKFMTTILGTVYFRICLNFK